MDDLAGRWSGREKKAVSYKDANSIDNGDEAFSPDKNETDDDSDDFMDNYTPRTHLKPRVPRVPKMAKMAKTRSQKISSTRPATTGNGKVAEYQLNYANGLDVGFHDPSPQGEGARLGRYLEAIKAAEDDKKSRDELNATFQKMYEENPAMQFPVPMNGDFDEWSNFVRRENLFRPNTPYYRASFPEYYAPPPLVPKEPVPEFVEDVQFVPPPGLHWEPPSEEPETSLDPTSVNYRNPALDPAMIVTEEIMNEYKRPEYRPVHTYDDYLGRSPYARQAPHEFLQMTPQPVVPFVNQAGGGGQFSNMSPQAVGTSPYSQSHMTPSAPLVQTGGQYSHMGTSQSADYSTSVGRIPPTHTWKNPFFGPRSANAPLIQRATHNAAYYAANSSDSIGLESTSPSPTKVTHSSPYYAANSGGMGSESTSPAPIKATPNSLYRAASASPSPTKVTHSSPYYAANSGGMGSASTSPSPTKTRYNSLYHAASTSPSPTRTTYNTTYVRVLTSPGPIQGTYHTSYSPVDGVGRMGPIPGPIPGPPALDTKIFTNQTTWNPQIHGPATGGQVEPPKVEPITPRKGD